MVHCHGESEQAVGIGDAGAEGDEREHVQVTIHDGIPARQG